MSQNPEKNWFGEKEVDPASKTNLVHAVFDSVADNYDLMNDLMSGGIHRLWKDSFVRMIRPRTATDFLDVAGGTGDIAFRIRKKAKDDAQITVCDLTHHMLATGQDRAIDKGFIDDRLTWVCGNAESIPMSDNSFDVYTISFGLRNVTHIDTALKEAHRVLRPGGRFYCLEFSHVDNPLLAKAYDFYSYNVIPKIGKTVAKDEDSYQYLVESIRKFPDQETLKNRLMEAGFDKAEYQNLTGGIAAIHTGWKY